MRSSRHILKQIYLSKNVPRLKKSKIAEKSPKLHIQQKYFVNVPDVCTYLCRSEQHNIMLVDISCKWQSVEICLRNIGSARSSKTRFFHNCCSLFARKSATVMKKTRFGTSSSSNISQMSFYALPLTGNINQHYIMLLRAA